MFHNHLLICPNSMVGAFIGSSGDFFTVMQIASTSTWARWPKMDRKVHSIEIALWVMLRDACIFALGVMNAQAPWLAQVGCSDMIGRGRVSLKAQTCTARRLCVGVRAIEVFAPAYWGALNRYFRLIYVQTLGSLCARWRPPTIIRTIYFQTPQLC